MPLFASGHLLDAGEQPARAAADRLDQIPYLGHCFDLSVDLESTVERNAGRVAGLARFQASLRASISPLILSRPSNRTLARCSSAVDSMPSNSASSATT